MVPARDVQHTREPGNGLLEVGLPGERKRMSRRADDTYPPGQEPPNVPYSRGTPLICYQASEELYHRLGGKDAGLTPMRIIHEGRQHWYLRWNIGWTTLYLDPTAGQYATPVPYADGVGCGFLTKHRSKPTERLFGVVKVP